jgi:hypothetical protein
MWEGGVGGIKQNQGVAKKNLLPGLFTHRGELPAGSFDHRGELCV